MFLRDDDEEEEEEEEARALDKINFRRPNYEFQPNSTNQMKREESKKGLIAYAFHYKILYERG